MTLYSHETVWKVCSRNGRQCNCNQEHQKARQRCHDAINTPQHNWKKINICHVSPSVVYCNTALFTRGASCWLPHPFWTPQFSWLRWGPGKAKRVLKSSMVKEKSLQDFHTSSTGMKNFCRKPATMSRLERVRMRHLTLEVFIWRWTLGFRNCSLSKAATYIVVLGQIHPHNIPQGKSGLR